jgi:hypothetical protein
VVWGPAVVQQPVGKDYAMNTMYVAQSASDVSQYVIGVAGTNPYSMLDWIIEDGFVAWQVPWVYALLHAPSAKIALGTATGLAILQNMKPAAGVPGAGQTLRQFLSTITHNKVNIAVAGHSLGGALAPTVALWLADTQGFLSHWDPKKNATISSLPTAGPTAGNGAFAAWTREKLGSAVTPFYNSIDVVPHAWLESMLAQIPSLYAPSIPAFASLKLLVDAAELLAKNGGYTTLSGLTALPGTVNTAIINPDQDNLKNFLAQLGYQHITAYNSWFNFNPAWYPPEPASRQAHERTSIWPFPDGYMELSPALTETISQKSIGASHVARHSGATRKLLIGTTLVDAPSGSDDARGAEVVALVEAELKKHGVSSAAG